MRKLVALFLVLTFAFSDIETIFDWPLLLKVEAAQVTIDSTVSTNPGSHIHAQASVVFISDQVGYKFYRDASGSCVYSKTSNGGTSWGGAVTVDAQTDCEAVEVWYDQWTPGDLGTNIHIVTMDSGNDDLWYNRLNTSGDSLLLGTAPVSVVLSQSNLSITAISANHSVTKSTNGILYVSISDNGDRFVVSCSSTCQTAGNWTEAGNGTQMDLDEDSTIMLPLNSGNVLLINRDITADDIRSKVWDGVNWSASWLTIDTNATENSSYPLSMSAVRSPVTGDVYLAYIADNANLNSGTHDVRLARYSGGSWTTLTDYVTNSTRALTSISLSIDENNNTVYLAYSGRTTPNNSSTGNVYWATSTTAMSSWGSERGPVNTTSGDIYGVNLNYFSNERIYATWYESAVDSMFGDTLADISPITVVSASGNQNTVVRADTTNFYVGGKFAIKENVAPRNVTGITIRENGSVNAATGLNNIKLRYDLDETSPFDCASESYSGSEPQYGTTDTNGFSGADGTSAFTGSVGISTTKTMCVYVVLDVLSAAADGTNMEIEISNPATDVLLSGGVTAIPAIAVPITGFTSIVDSVLTQTHYHWRNDNGNEGSATSRTGGIEDTPLNAVQKEAPRRLRFGISNEGSTSTLPTTLRLEYAQNISTCADATGWTDVGAVDDDWNMYNSTFITDGTDTTNISNAIGGVSNENTVFLSPNGGQRDTSSSLSALTFLPTNWTEAEFSIVASTSATEGNTYCFRLTNAGQPLPAYTNYPRATIAADVTVRATSTQDNNVDIPTNNFYIGGGFAIIENDSSRNVTSITITENGTVDGLVGVENIRLYYDLDITAPYDCTGESYVGGELQFGSATTSFSAPNGNAVFSDSVGITTTQVMCVYVVLDVTSAARNGETIDITINSGTNDVLVTNGGSVAPSTVLDITGSTSLSGAIVTQMHYHWRNDDGSEIGATSATLGVEDTPLLDFAKNSAIRLRVGLSNEGATTSVPRRYGLEYGIKTSTCDAITVWSDADGGGVSWNMFDSSNLTNGETTTNITEASGGVTDENTTFITSNGGVRDTESFSATTTMKETEYVDLEYSITTTSDTPYETPFCFRVTQNGTPLLAYNQYAEITIEPKRDFRIQRGISIVSGTSLTLTAGLGGDYIAPSASTSAFVRITNSHYTGAGKDTLGNNQNTDDYAAYISNAENIETNFTISRDVDSVNNTYVAWEIVEYIGPPGGDNEIIVRGQSVVNLGTTQNIGTGTAATTIFDDNDMVVFITGQLHDGGNRTEAFGHQFTASWAEGSNQPVFQRGANGGNNASVSYAAVEFTGLNWKVQRIEHVYGPNATTTQTQSISAVNSLARTFIHSQKRYGASGVMSDFGHEVWLSSVGAVSFLLEPLADTSVNHVAVVWIVENIQATVGGMYVQRSNGNTTGGSEPLTLSINIPTRLNGTNNASIFITSSLDAAGTNYPRQIAGAAIVSTSTYEIWRSDTGNVLSYRTEVVQWPVADLAVRQNYYRFYVDNNDITPTDAWPPGGVNLGENTSIGALDEPLADFDRIRIRMTLKVANATLPAGLIATKLQYGVQDGTCSAVSVWTDVGAPGSGSIWRGYNASGIVDGTSISGNPPTGGDLLISIADRAGRYTESNPSLANEFGVLENEEVEYDWLIEQNGAAQRTVYCFRMIKSDNTTLDGYIYYPEIRTEGFTLVVEMWRWYDDEANETPTSPLANEDIAPTNVLKGNSVKLRVAVDEIKNLPQANAGFKLQFAKKADFSDVQDVVSTTSCAVNSVWCYYDTAEVDKSIISTSVLSGSDSCVAAVGDGCGTYIESSNYVNGFTHTADSSREYEFALNYTNVERNYGQVYYFRLYDLANNEIVLASTSNPSLAGESARLVLTVDGVDAGTIIAGVTMDATTTATAVDFGSLPIDTDVEVAQQITVDTNAIEGYQVYKYADQQLLNSYGNPIDPITGTNAAPVGWSVGCIISAVSCFGYHTTDATLENASGRFAPIDSYAALSTSLEEVMYSSVATIDTENMVYRIRVSELQEAGDYSTSINYIAVPVY